MTLPKSQTSTVHYLLRLRNDAQVGFGCLPALGILLLGFVVRNSRQNNHVLALLPVHRRRDLMLGGASDAGMEATVNVNGNTDPESLGARDRWSV